MMNKIYFNDYFGIKESTGHLNIPLNEDLEAFICPFKIVNNRHLDVFGNVYYRNKTFLETLNGRYVVTSDRANGLNFLLNLHESNEYHLGYSSKNRGKGIGGDKAVTIYDALRNNKFASQGISVTNESQNVLLLVGGIGPDNMSDTISNVCRDIFAEYTYNQCVKYGIQMYDFDIEFFDSLTKKWQVKKVKLPAYKGEKIILVPKDMVSSRRAFHVMYNWFISDNHISREILNGKIKVSDYDRYIKSLPKKGKKPIVKHVFKDFSKPKNELIDFVVQYGDKTLLDFQDHLKNELPEVDFEN